MYRYASRGHCCILGYSWTYVIQCNASWVPPYVLASAPFRSCRLSSPVETMTPGYTGWIPPKEQRPSGHAGWVPHRNRDSCSCRLIVLEKNATGRQADVNGPIKCSSLKLEREEHLQLVPIQLYIRIWSIIGLLDIFACKSLSSKKSINSD